MQSKVVGFERSYSILSRELKKATSETLPYILAEKEALDKQYKKWKEDGMIG